MCHCNPYRMSDTLAMALDRDLQRVRDGSDPCIYGPDSADIEIRFFHRGKAAIERHTVACVPFALW